MEKVRDNQANILHIGCVSKIYKGDQYVPVNCWFLSNFYLRAVVINQRILLHICEKLVR